MDKRNRQARLPIEPIYCAAPQEPHDILCPGSDDELDEPARLAKRLRYEEQGLRYLEGRPPRLISASLKGPFDKGWQNPWLPKRLNTKTPVSRPTAPRPAVKSTASKALAKRPGSKNDTPVTRDSMQCHLPSPESNREVQLDDNASLDSEKRFLIHDWANGVSSDTLGRDEFWAPDQGRGADPHGNSKKRPAASDWLKSKLSKRKISNCDAPSSTIHTPTPPVAVIVQASTALNPDLPITSLEMTTPSSSTGLCSAKSMGKSFDPMAEEEDTVMSSDSVSSSGDGSQAHVSQQDAADMVVDTNTPQTSPPRPPEDHRQTLPERSEAGELGEADIAFESHMDDSFHYRIRPIQREVARSASPILITTETGTQPEQMEPSGQENNQRSKSCGVQEPTLVKDHPRQDCQLAAILERADDTAEKFEEAHPNETTSYHRALSLPSRLCSEGCTVTAELDATKRAKSLGPIHQPEKHHKPVTLWDQDAVMLPFADIAMPKNRDPAMDHTNLPTTRVVGQVAIAPISSHAGEEEGAQDVQMEAPSNEEASAAPTKNPGIEGKTFPSTRNPSLEKLVSEDDTTLIGDATHIVHKPHRDACAPGSDSPSVSPEVGVMAEVVHSAKQNETPIQSAVSGFTVPRPEPETALVQDVTQEAPENELEFEDPAVQQTASPMEPRVPEQKASSPARLSGHIEERPETPNLDKNIGEREHLEERSRTPDMDEHTGGEDRFEERPSSADMDGRTGEEEVKAVSPLIEMQHMAEPGARDLQSEPVEGWVPSPRHMTLASTPISCPGQQTIGVSQQTPWASTGLEATLGLELSVKSFAKFNTPSPKHSHRSYRYSRLSGGHLPSTPLLFDAASTNPWSTGQSIRRSVGHSSRRVSFAPLPGEEEAATEQPSARSITRPKSPPPSFDAQEGAEDLDDQFSSHFNAVRTRRDQEPKSGMQRLLPTESQQQLSPAVNAMAEAFRETDAYHTHILEDCPTPASGLQETAETEERDERIEAPQSPWRSDTQTHAYDDVAAVLQNLDDFLNPKWDTEASRKPARRSGGLDYFEDQENRGIQVGLDGSGTWEMA